MEAKPGGLPLVSCRQCELLATWPAPRTDDSSSDLFDMSYSGQRNSRRRQWAHEAKQRLAWVETWAPEGILLEVGCATGEFVEEATAVGYEALGVEPSRWAAGIARRSGAKVLCGNLADWAAEYAGFTVDGVAMFHVLEHVEDPLELLRQSRSVLVMMAGFSSRCPTLPVKRPPALPRPGWVGNSASITGISPPRRCRSS